MELNRGEHAGLCLRIVRASLTNGFRRSATPTRATRRAARRLVPGEAVDVAQLAEQQERAVHALVGGHDLGELEQLLGGLVGGVLEQAVAGALDPLAGAGGRAAVRVVLVAADLVGRLAAEVGSTRGAVAAFRPLRFRGPPAEPGVRVPRTGLSTGMPVLIWRSVLPGSPWLWRGRAARRSRLSTGAGSARPGSGSGWCRAPPG